MNVVLKRWNYKYFEHRKVYEFIRMKSEYDIPKQWEYQWLEKILLRRINR
jgi:hypothetical protein